jgi:hypothetical protein
MSGLQGSTQDRANHIKPSTQDSLRALTLDFGLWTLDFGLDRQSYYAQNNPEPAPIDEMRRICIARIKTRLKRIDAGKNPGRSLFELSEYVACLTVIDSRN